MTGWTPQVDGGWANDPEQRRRLFTYLPTGPGDPEPASAVADAWEPPAELSLPVELCDRVMGACGALLSPSRASGNGDYYDVDLTPQDRAEVLDRFTLANELWWGLDVTSWDLGLKRYRPGDRHVAHQDLHPGIGARRKFAGSVQMSQPDAYEGGNLWMWHAGQLYPTPRARGTLIAFPGWTVHEVEPVTSGERWSLVVNGRGPVLR